jgi:hypothetical protein
VQGFGELFERGLGAPHQSQPGTRAVEGRREDTPQAAPGTGDHDSSTRHVGVRRTHVTLHLS